MADLVLPYRLACDLGYDTLAIGMLDDSHQCPTVPLLTGKQSDCSGIPGCKDTNETTGTQTARTTCYGVAPLVAWSGTDPW